MDELTDKQAYAWATVAAYVTVNAPEEIFEAFTIVDKERTELKEKAWKYDDLCK